MLDLHRANSQKEFVNFANIVIKIWWCNAKIANTLLEYCIYNISLENN